MHHAIDRANEMAKYWWTLGLLTADTQFVMTMRVMGMSGAWSVPKDENSAMFTEKAPAFAEAMVAGTLTALSGRGPDRVLQAAIEPISQKARANRTRLAGRGPLVFGASV